MRKARHPSRRQGPCIYVYSCGLPKAVQLFRDSLRIVFVPSHLKAGIATRRERVLFAMKTVSRQSATGSRGTSPLLNYRSRQRYIASTTENYSQHLRQLSRKEIDSVIAGIKE